MQLDIPSDPFDGYIFDLDGTLVDSMPVHYLAWDAVLREYGLASRLDEDLFYSFGGVPTERVAQLLGEHYGLTLDPQAVARRKEEMYRDGLANISLIQPVVDFARRVSATHPIAIATGGLPEVAYPTLERSGLRSLFNIVITPQDVLPGRGKPQPDMFLLAAQRMGVNPVRCLVFEDAEPGRQAAIAAGMKVVMVPSRKH